MKVAVINSGSSSIKYEVFDAQGCVMLAAGLIERIGSADGRLMQRRRKADGSFDEQVHRKPVPDHRAGFALMEDVNAVLPARPMYEWPTLKIFSFIS